MAQAWGEWPGPLSGQQQDAITSLTDSTTGTASNTLNDTTASVKDDMASVAAKIEEILDALRACGIIKASYEV